MFIVLSGEIHFIITENLVKTRNCSRYYEDVASRAGPITLMASLTYSIPTNEKMNPYPKLIENCKKGPPVTIWLTSADILICLVETV